jgi:SSS family solute:Na+ symporter
MELHSIDIAIIALYMLGMVAIGFMVERRAGTNLGEYFLGGHRMPWWLLSMSNAASMFDISGTTWLVSLLFVYGLKSVFIPWLWPVFNQIFLMVYLSTWLRRSGVMTGAEWITLRFGTDRGAEASRISVVVFALVSVIAFTSYAFVGIAKFAEIFLPSTFSPNTYALIIVGVTTLYTTIGGFYGVVITDLIQFFIKLLCCVVLGAVAMERVSPEALAAVVPAGWREISFGWHLNIDWSHLLPAANESLLADGYTLFGAFFMMAVCKGILVSAAGPAPNYDMQRILAARNPREAAMMSGLVTVVLFVPRYFMIAGITVLALVYMHDDIAARNTFDFEQVLPIVIRDYLPAGLAGLLIAGLLAAFMSTFSGTINAAAAYLVNDVYKRYWHSDGTDREYIRVSYLASFAVVAAGCAAGYFTPSVAKATDWIVSGLWGGYAAANILKWHWHRFNGYGYFWGMITGIGGALTLFALPEVRPLFAFPLLLLVSAIGSVVGSLLTNPQDPVTLINFYVRTRPWGFWGPIERAAAEHDPSVRPNCDFGRDMFNVLIGVIWQTAFMALPIYVVIKDWREAGLSAAIIALTSVVLKFSWYDRLESQTVA